MNNKKAKQIALKEKHRELLKTKRRKEPTLERQQPSLNEKPTILIVCEGENTEPSYFRQFKLSSATIKPIGEGHNTLSLVKRTIQLSKEDIYQQVWCVFDADPKKDNPKQLQNFNSAIQLAQKNGFGIAYSNQAFEYWIILHFEDHQGGGMDRGDYDKKLNKLLNPFGLEYDGKGTKVITEEMFEILDGIDHKTSTPRVDIAIKRAERNYDMFDHSNPGVEESSTTVFKLVVELMKYL